MSGKIRIACKECGSTDVLRDAYASWNEEEQEWQLYAVYDQAVCEGKCQGECSLVEELIE